MVNGGLNLQPYVHPDCGAHYGVPFKEETPEMFVRCVVRRQTSLARHSAAAPHFAVVASFFKKSGEVGPKVDPKRGAGKRLGCLKLVEVRQEFKKMVLRQTWLKLRPL